MTQPAHAAAGTGPTQPGWLLDAGDERQVGLLRQAIKVVLAAGVLAFVVRGADRPADPSLGPPAPSTTEAPAPPPAPPASVPSQDSTG